MIFWSHWWRIRFGSWPACAVHADRSGFLIPKSQVLEDLLHYFGILYPATRGITFIFPEHFGRRGAYLKAVIELEKESQKKSVQSIKLGDKAASDMSQKPVSLAMKQIRLSNSWKTRSNMRWETGLNLIFPTIPVTPFAFFWKVLCMSGKAGLWTRVRSAETASHFSPSG